MNNRWSRRDVLAGALGLFALGRTDAFAGAAWDLTLGRLNLTTPETELPPLANLAQAVAHHTSIRVNQMVESVHPADVGLFQFPFLVLSGTQAFPSISPAGRDALRAWLGSGGTLLIDDRTGSEDNPFWESVERELAAIFPGREPTPLPADHAVARSFFLSDTGHGRRPIRPYLLGIDLGDTTPVLVSRNDLLGALDGDISFNSLVGWRGDAVGLAINIVVYAVTSNYKKDAVHVKTLLERLQGERGRWR